MKQWRITAYCLQAVEAEVAADGAQRIIRNIGAPRPVMMVKFEAQRESGDWDILWEAPQPLLLI
jgi:hypothetical protein